MEKNDSTTVEQIRAQISVAKSRLRSRRCRPLPIEIWEYIIDLLQYDLDALMACSAASPALQPRCQFHAPKQYYGETVTFRYRQEVTRIGKQKTTRWKGPQYVYFHGGSDGQRLPIPHFATWAAMLAGRWTQLKWLWVENAEWRITDMYPDMFADLSNFISITNLILHNVTFSTVAAFGRLVCALPSLESLHCSDTDFVARHFNRAAFLTCASRMRLSRVVLNSRASIDLIANFFVVTDICSNFTNVTVGNAERHSFRAEDFETASLRGFLQGAGASLRKLHWAALAPDEYHIDLSSNTKLEKLELTIIVDRVDFDRCSLSHVLSKITSSVIGAICIEFVIRPLVFCERNEIHQVLTRLVGECCSPLDHIFALPVFSRLYQVYFDVLVPENAVDMSDALLKRILPYELPEIHRRGIMRLSVKTDTIYPGKQPLLRLYPPRL